MIFFESVSPEIQSRRKVASSSLLAVGSQKVPTATNDDNGDHQSLRHPGAVGVLVRRTNTLATRSHIAASHQSARSCPDVVASISTQFENDVIQQTAYTQSAPKDGENTLNFIRHDQKMGERNKRKQQQSHMRPRERHIMVVPENNKNPKKETFISNLNLNARQQQ